MILRLRWFDQGRLYVANFVPLWNFFIFRFGSPSAVIGPITGSGVVNLNHFFGSLTERLNVLILRNIICTFLYKVSSFIIKTRKLNLKPATPFVSKYIQSEKVNYLYVVACLDVERVINVKANPQMAETDVLIYTNKHILKNNALICDVVDLLSKEGFSCAVLGTTGKEIGGTNNLGFVDRNVALSAIKKSKIILSCSLEGAGFFASEAALLDKKILCFPDTGASYLPGAVKICEKQHKVAADDIVRLVNYELKILDTGFIQNEMRALIQETRNFYDISQR